MLRPGFARARLDHTTTSRRALHRRQLARPTTPYAVAMGCLLGPVAADRHAAPASGVTARVVDEKERASGALAGLHVREILAADESGQCLPDRQQKGVRSATVRSANGPAPVAAGRSG